MGALLCWDTEADKKEKQRMTTLYVQALKQHYATREPSMEERREMIMHWQDWQNKKITKETYDLRLKRFTDWIPSCKYLHNTPDLCPAF